MTRRVAILEIEFWEYAGTLGGSSTTDVDGLYNALGLAEMLRGLIDRDSASIRDVRIKVLLLENRNGAG